MILTSLAHIFESCLPISAMRLIKVDTHAIHEFFGDGIPDYAILSHTWGEEEVTFRDMQHLDEKVKKKRGFKKIVYTCEQAQRDGLCWAWVDTCCIDNTSSAELTEAINSMYTWYGDSATCYAHLVDVPLGDDPFAEQSAFRRSRWFTRGWTLQELIAPREVAFYDREWEIIGTKSFSESIHCRVNKQMTWKCLGKLLENITGIPEDCLAQYRSPSSYSVAKRMCWASKRQCTRVEDVAYSLIGIFDINMPLLYGEGVKAFIRLQEEILKEIDDHSLFAWTAREDTAGSVFAQSPAEFALSGNIIPVQEESGELSAMTRKGLRITLGLRPAKTSHLHQVPEAFYAILNCARDHDTTQRIALLLIVEALNPPSPPFYRCATKEHLVVRNDETRAFHTIYVRKNVPPEVSHIFAFSKQRFSRYTYSSLDMLKRIHRLSLILLNLEKHDKTEEVYRWIHDGMENALGEEHPSTLASLNNWALVLQSLGKHEEAEAVHRRTLEGRKMVLGEDHLDTLMTLNDLASVLQDLGKQEEAEILHRRALEGRKEALGVAHWDTLTSLSNLALTLWDLGKREEAEAFHRQAVEGRELVLGRGHPSHNPYPREVTVSISSRMSPAEDGQTLLTTRGPRVYRPRIDISHITQSRVHVRSESKWINCMGDFAAFIRTVPRKIAPPVKIAVISYGFNDSLDILTDNVVWIKSFWSHRNSTGMMNAYLSRGSDKHWIRMAAAISHICPRSHLYVALLEYSGVDGNGKPQATAESAAEAIKWAISCDVDIISMSCITEGRIPVTNSMLNFNGLTFSCGFNPGCGHVIIGNEDHIPPGYGVDFTFPGKNIRFMDDEMIVYYESGSSVATAFASGLAGLLVYCNRLVVEKDHLRHLQMRDRIIRAFRVMIPSNSSYLPRVDDFFGERFKYLLSPDNETIESVVIPDQKWNETSKEALWKLIKELCVMEDP